VADGATSSALLDWLREKLAEAEKHLQYRIQGEEDWRSGTDEEWKAAEKLSGEKAPSKAERIRAADSYARIAVKCRREVEMFKAALTAAKSRPASFDEVWQRLRPFMPDDYATQQAIIMMDAFGWIDNGPCTCGLEVYGDPCPHHSKEAANG